MIFTVHIITLCSEIFPGPLGSSVIGRSLREGKWNLNVINLRDSATDKHKTVDDRPYGGGPGMILRPDVIANSLEELPVGTKIFHMSPRGKLFTQSYARQIIKHQEIAIICSRFEGVDQRALDYFQIEEISIGSFILSNGDLATMVLLDCCVRLLPGTLGNEDSIKSDSFTEGEELEHDLYTKPQEWRGRSVPEVLLSGNHQKIKKWQKESSKLRTLQRSNS